MSANDNKLLIKLGELPCCVDLSALLKITTLVQLQPIPLVPGYIKGHFNFAGEQLMAIDLAERLSLSQQQPYTLDTPMLICQSKGIKTGFIVDEVIGVESVDEHHSQLEASFDCRDHIPFKGIMQCTSGQSLWLDIDQVIQVFVSQLANDCGPEILAKFQSLVAARV